jgi:hypothetical protein
MGDRMALSHDRQVRLPATEIVVQAKVAPIAPGTIKAEFVGDGRPVL